MLQLNAQVSAQDLEKQIAFVKADSQQQRQFNLASELKILAIFMLVGFAVSFLLGDIWKDIYVGTAARWFFAESIFLLVFSIAGSVIWLKRGGMAAWLSKCSGNYAWELNAQGISIRLNASSNFFPWSKIIAFVESDDAWHFYLRRNFAISIPKQAANQGDSVAKLAAEYWCKHPDNDGLTLQTDFLSGLKQKSFWGDLSSNLLGGLKLAFFVKVTALSFKVRTSQWLALIAFDIALIAFFDYCVSGPNPRFNLHGVSDYSLNYALLLLATMTICYLLVAKFWLPRLMVMLLAAGFAINLFYLPLRSAFILQDGHSGTWLHWLVWAVSIGWLLLVVARAIRLLFNYPLPTIGVLTAAYSFFVLALAGLFTQQQFFIKDYAEDYADYAANKIDIESTYYAQAKLVQQALDAAQVERSGVADLYFVGLAGTSYQDVFKNEVNAAQQLLDTQFGTKNRSIMLINHAKTMNTLPLANLPNLSAVLNGLAQKMNKDEDILFLFLSSHGSAPSHSKLGKNQKDYEISTEFYPLEPNSIEAKKLKMALDASGIKNRVIVVSSCYSGGFIDALKDDNSLIMTASRKDRTSFGCSNEEKYTYFGDAYFVQSLANAAKAGQFDFSLAFESAKKIITKKERKEVPKDLPSEPQMFEGAAIKNKLKELQVRLQAAK